MVGHHGRGGLDSGSADRAVCGAGVAVRVEWRSGGDEIGPMRSGRGVEIMAIVDCHALPFAVTTHAAKHHEVTLVQLTFD
ncbi:MAG: hypothetical protein WB781_25890, partial [Candidatus Sulfotelmatobacter sp.]